MDSFFFSPLMLLKSSPIIILLISSLFNISSSQAQNLKIQNFLFGNPFNLKNSSQFALLDQATINNGALQVTPDSANPDFLPNRSGRIFFNQSFKLWDNNQDPTGNGKVVSFNTSFDINVFRFNNNLPGEGLAFLLAPDLTFPANSKGEYLGLTNSTTDGDSSNNIVAIELDTSKEDSVSDPDNNHIGLNIHSVRSNKTESLSKFGIQIARGPVDPKNYTVWIQYDGNNKTIKAYMAERGEPKPATPVLSSNLNLKGLVKQESYFGFSASTGTDVQLNCVLAWNLTVEMIPGAGDGDGGSKGNAVKIWVPVGVAIAAVVVVAVIGGLWYYYVWRKRRTPDPNLLTALQSLPGTPKEFRYRDLKRATNNFDEQNKLGQGGFGVVYKGLLRDENKLVAVKKFSRGNLEGRDDFLSELTIINRLRHRHLVPLLGWCHYQSGMLLLVYDYMPNGSLDGHLFCEGEGSTMLEWNLRYNIVSGVASALHYLHYEYDQRVVHRDLKASNILLDSEFNARLGDFGLARCLENEKTSYADQMGGVAGTVGYIAPECLHTTRATRESDVFAFGAVVLEVVCGQRPWTKIENFQFLVDWVWSLHREGRILDAVDKRLNGDYVVEEAERLLLLGLACSHPIAGERPKTRAIFQIISGSMPVPRVPPFKPAFVWPSTIGTLSSLDLDSTTDITPMTSGWTPQCVSPDSYGAERHIDGSLV